MNRFLLACKQLGEKFIPAARNKFVPCSFSFKRKGKRRSPHGWPIRAKGDVNERPEDGFAIPLSSTARRELTLIVGKLGSINSCRRAYS
jgi:hypothetical protein